MEKEIKFEVGKWYKNSNWISNKDFIKCSNTFIEHNSICGNEYIINGKWYSNHVRWYSPETCVLASFEEIQQYLPYGHPDKIQLDSEFKVGDYIFVMIKGKNFGDILKVEDIIIETKTDYSGICIRHTPNSFSGGGFRLNGNGYIYGKDVRHATSEEINNHLISIGLIPANESSNIGITSNNYSSDISYSNNSIKPKTILSINDEELPMVSIIKIKTVNLLKEK
jgi:hypothetical protein